MDIVIPLGPNDLNIIQRSIDSCHEYIEEIKNVYVISFDASVSLNNCIMIKEFLKDRVDSILPDRDRNKWYLQQLIKLYAHQHIPDLSDDYLVVDADTIFYKRVHYKQDGKYWFQIRKRPLMDDLDPYYYHAKRVHPTLISPLPDHHFIHHQMIFNRYLLLELFKIVESYHKKPFWWVFLHEIKDGYYINGASEYEIYAVFLCVYFPNKIMTRTLPYEQSIGLDEAVDETSYWVNYHYHWLSDTHCIHIND